MPKPVIPEVAQQVLQFWYGDIAPDGSIARDISRRWFVKDPQFDDSIHTRFGSVVAQALDGGLDRWLDHPHSILALILVCDQFPRNLFRNDPKSFSLDPVALIHCKHLIASGEAEQLKTVHQLFAYMPLMHSELLSDQDQCLTQFSALKERSEEHLKGYSDGSIRAAHQHRKIIGEFGRFPHRNKALGRETTPKEVTFLTQPGSSF